MRKTTLSALLLAGLAGGLIATSAGAAADKPYTAPKTAFGQPDIQGVWTNATLTTLTRDKQYGDRLVLTPSEVAVLEGDEAAARAAGDAPTDPSLTVEDLPVNCGRGFSGTNCGYNSGWTDPGSTIMRVHGEPRSSFITFPADGQVPAPKAGAQVYNPYAAYRRPGFSRDANPETMSLAEQCLTSFGNSAGPVMLPLLYNNNYKIVQGKDAVAIWVEMVHDVRTINIGAKHRTDGVRPWWGDSIGWYEGNTLVVETTNYPKANAFRGAWEDLKVTERFTRVADNRLLYQFKVEAPSIWDQPWGGEYEFSASNGIYEYACHEGNYALEDMLAGARAEEAEAAAKPQAAN